MNRCLYPLSSHPQPQPGEQHSPLPLWGSLPHLQRPVITSGGYANSGSCWGQGCGLAAVEGWLRPCAVIPSAGAVLSDSRGGSQLRHHFLESSQGPAGCLLGLEKGSGFLIKPNLIPRLEDAAAPKRESSSKGQAGIRKRGGGKRQRYARCATQPPAVRRYSSKLRGDGWLRSSQEQRTCPKLEHRGG